VFGSWVGVLGLVGSWVWCIGFGWVWWLVYWVWLGLVVGVWSASEASTSRLNFIEALSRARFARLFQ